MSKRIKIPEQLHNEVKAYHAQQQAMLKRVKEMQLKCTRELNTITGEASILSSKFWENMSNYIPEVNSEPARLDEETMEIVFGVDDNVEFIKKMLDGMLDGMGGF